MALPSLEPPARVVDWGILTLVVTLLASGVAALMLAPADDGLVITLHALAGVSLVGFLFFKLRRVLPRVTRGVGAVSRGTVVASVGLTVLALLALASGLVWVHVGLVWVGPWTLVTLHAFVGLLVVPFLLVHLRAHLYPPTRADATRRAALRSSALLAGGAVVWRAQRTANDLFSWPGRARRVTGSKASGSDAGNDFPVTSWVADAPDPVDVDTWSLRVGGAVENPRDLEDSDLPGTGGDATAVDGDSERALLDCTSGWYSEHEWQGVRVGELLDAAGADPDARWVRFESVTGYRWSFEREEARDLLLATHVDGERLNHGHGFPVRLVAPGHRGYRWVKWVTRVDVTTRRDFGQWVAIFVSGFD